MLKVQKNPEILLSDDTRVIPRFLDFQSPERVREIVRRVAALSPPDVQNILERVLKRFCLRHRQLEDSCRQNFVRAAGNSRLAKQLSPDHQLLIGAYFTLEYSIESAALFNPSIVVHPDQTGLSEGHLRFLMSLRATGEGHVSSIVFRRGVMDADGEIAFDPPPRFAHAPRPIFPKATADKQIEHVLTELQQTSVDGHAATRISERLLWLAKANYDLYFPTDCHPSEIVIFPATRFERRGMEDLRLVRFQNPDGNCRYFGTYTAYDGQKMYPMLLETEDFRRVHVSALNGRYAKNKGMALFPRKINGSYYMLSRHDGENLFVLRSRDLHTWNTARQIICPEFPWELVQVGNCGSPVETEAGWLVVTHGVGPMREYSIGVSLLDRDDPTQVIGRLPEPLLTANESERVGYVPNVVYSCGSLIHQSQLIVPYAMSDSRTAFARVDIQELLAELKINPAQR